MISVESIISELAGIKNALSASGSARPPNRRPRLGSPPIPARSSPQPVIIGDELDVSEPSRWEEEKQRARQAIEGDRQSASGEPLSGIEALAWYVSFHVDQNGWGIYIPLSSLALMDELYFSGLAHSREQRLDLAWKILLWHEQAHFAFDLACAWFELLLRAPIHREFRSRFRSSPPLPTLTVVEDYLQVEETAANAHMLRKISATQGARALSAVESFVATQPVGYREALSHTSTVKFEEIANETLKSYIAVWALEHKLKIGSSALDLMQILPLSSEACLDQCPVYTIDDLEEVGIRNGSLRLVHRIEDVIETKGFSKLFERQHPKIQQDWLRKKDEIKVALPAPPRFEKLKGKYPAIYSLRLRDGHRVHLQPNEGSSSWSAIEIGNHKGMGHG